MESDVSTRPIGNEIRPNRILLQAANLTGNNTNQPIPMFGMKFEEKSPV
jgi:hypothetical protein